jgi:xanthine/CO dehydrogenase XdhC/CoxF family maturation factor
MNSLRDQFENTRRQQQQAVLATIVNKEGSTYRNIGAKILIPENGTVDGLISGGCLENDVIEAAESVFSSGQGKLVSFDTRSAHDIVFGSGVGCQGRIWVFLERLPALTEEAMAAVYFGGAADGINRASCLVTAGTDQLVSWTGTRFVLSELNQSFNLPFTDEILAWGQSRLAISKAGTKTFEGENGSLEVFLDVLRPIPQIHIIGAGADAIPVHNFVTQLGWDVHLYDRRPAFAVKSRFPKAKSISIGGPEDFFDHFHSSPHNYIVLMSHNYLVDQDYLRHLLALDLPFIGLLGPKTRGQQMIEEISFEGMVVTAQMRRKVYNPIGLDLGGEGPEAIALAIVAQLQCLITGKSRSRAEPLYDDVDSERTSKLGGASIEFG